jgi:hypothetical protein
MARLRDDLEGLSLAAGAGALTSAAALAGAVGGCAVLAETAMLTVSKTLANRASPTASPTSLTEWRGDSGSFIAILPAAAPRTVNLSGGGLFWVDTTTVRVHHLFVGTPTDYT